MAVRPRIEIWRFIASLGALGAVLVAVPLVLARVASARFGSVDPLAGVPGPWEWNASDIGDVLRHPIDDSTTIDALIRICLCVAWIAVAVIAVTTVVEIVHMLRHHGLAMPTVRGVGWAQGIARFIAVGLLVVVPLGSTKPSLAATRPPVGGPEIVATLAVAPADVAPPPTADTLPADSGATSYTVRRGDSIFSIAADLAGHDERQTMVIANEILDVNLGSLMPDGQRFTNPAYVEIGWVLIVPDNASTSFAVTSPPDASPVDATPPETIGNVHVVAPGDTLWEIAKDELGDGSGWVAIWEQNAGDDMGDGRTFDDPDLILPGWDLELPDEPTPELAVAVDPERVPESTVVEPTEAIPTIPAIDSTASAVSTVPPSTATPPTTTTTVAPGPTQRPDTGVDRGVAPDAPSPIRIEQAAMLAAGILALVGVRRRQRLRAARPRSRVPQPRPDVVETELLLRRIDPGERAARVDVACRSAAFALIDTDVQIVVVQVSAEGDVVLTLSGAAMAPPPWTSDEMDTGTTWRLAAGIPVELLSEQARRVGMPCVALVQLGVDDDGNDVLIDVEACGTVAVDAHPAQADAVVRALAAGLATSLYAEVAHLITVSLSTDVLLGHRNAHRVESLDAAFDLAASLVGSTSTNERSSFELRSLRTGGEMWEPAVIVLPDADHAGDHLAADQLPPPGHGIGLIATVGPNGLSQAPARVIAHADRWNLVVARRSISLTPIGLDRADIDAVVSLLQDAEQPLIWMDGPVPPRGPSDPTACGGPSGPLAIGVAGGGDDEFETTDGNAAPVEPFQPMEHAVLVRLLGGVEVTDRDGTTGQFERSKTVELIAWLATHRAHSTRGAARTALWELDVRDATFANVVSEARRGLSRLVAPPAGEEWLARTLTEQLPLHPWVVTDAQLIEERLEQARLEPPARAIETLRPAVEMIAGMPFADTSYLWPDAEGITSNLVLLAISAAAELAAHALSIGDTEVVFWSTGQGLSVLPGHEELIALRMRAHARAGDLAAVRQEWESYERVVVADTWSDGEPAPKLLALRRDLLTASDARPTE